MPSNKATPAAAADASPSNEPLDGPAVPVRPNRPLLLPPAEEHLLRNIRNHPTRFPERAKRYIAIVSDKGGIGKSTWLTQLVQYYLTIHPNVRMRAFDPDDANKTLQGFQPAHTTFIDVDRSGALDLPAAQLFDDQIDVALLDGLGSRQTKTFVRWTDDVIFHELAATFNVAPTYVLLVEEDADVVRQSSAMIKRVGPLVDWLIVRNYKQSDHMKLWDDCAARQMVLSELGGVEVTYPRVQEQLSRDVATYHLPYALAGADKRVSVFDRQRFRSLTSLLEAQFDAIQAILLPGAAKP